MTFGTPQIAAQFPLDRMLRDGNIAPGFPMHAHTKLLFSLMLVLYGNAFPLHAAPPLPAATQSVSPEVKQTLEDRLMGAWVLAEATTPGTPSGIGIRQKIFTRGRWEIIQKDPKTGELIFQHGGTYRLDGDVLEQKVDFASQKTKSYIGQVRRYRITVEKDTYIQIGIGNPFNEVWKRLDSA